MAAAQGFFGADAGYVGVVVAFGEVGQYQVAGTGVKAFGIGEKFADRVIGEVASAAHHALLDVPGVGTDLEHLDIVIRFKHQNVAIAQVMLDQLGHVAEVGNHGDFDAARAKRKAQRVDGIVRNRKRGDFDIANREALARLNEIHTRQAPGVRLGEHAQGFGMRRGREINRGAPLGEQGGQPADMVGMFVRDDDAVEPLGGLFVHGKAAKGFALAEAGIDQETRLRRLDQRTVARAARRQDAYAKADAAPRFVPRKCGSLA